MPAGLDEAYAQIGKLLLICEAATPSIGIPWIPPTQRTRGLRTQFEEPLKDYVRQTLVNVQTIFIESYAQDLENLRANEISARRLRINGLTTMERNALTAILFLVCFTLILVSTVYVNAGVGLGLGLGLLVASVVATVSSYVCAEESRRSTFHWLLLEEILRRKGIDQPGSSTVPLYGSPAIEGLID